MIIAYLIALLLAPAQSPGPQGTWQVVFDGDMRRVSADEWKVMKRSKATLVLQQHGDSLSGTWQTELMKEAAALRGTYDGKTLKLTTGARETVGQVDGKPTKMVVRQDWSGSFDGKTLRGILFIHLGERTGPPRKWEATRTH